jgi:hypothetical protein
MASGMEELRRRLEILLGAKPEAPVDESMQVTGRALGALSGTGSYSPEVIQRRERLAEAGGELLGSAFQFLSQLINVESSYAPPNQLVTDLQNSLAQCAEEDEQGRQRLTITLPDRGMLDSLAQTMARLLVVGQDENSQQPAGTR